MKQKINCLTSSLLTIDFYGAPFFFHLDKENFKNQTKLGGFYSLILIIGTIIFGIHRVVSWYKNEIPPFIIQFGKTESGLVSLPLYQEIITIAVYNDNFDKNKLFFIPVIQQWKGEDFTNINYTLTNNNCTLLNSFCLENLAAEKLLLQHNQLLEDNSEDLSYSIFLYKCQSQYLSDNQTCADEEEQKQFLDGNSYIGIKLYLNRFDKKQHKMEKYNKEYYLYLDKDTYFTANVLVKSEHLTYNNGYPFNFPQEKLFLSEASFFQQNIVADQGMMKTALQKPAFGEIYLYLDENSIETQISEQKVLDLIVMIFSFFKLAYSAGAIFYYRSENHLRRKLLIQLNSSKNTEKQLTNDEIYKKEIRQFLHLINLLTLIRQTYNYNPKNKETLPKNKQINHQDISIFEEKNREQYSQLEKYQFPEQSARKMFDKFKNIEERGYQSSYEIYQYDNNQLQSKKNRINADFHDAQYIYE